MHTPARQSEIFLTRALGKTLRALALTCTLALSGILTLKQVQGTECPGGPFEPYVQEGLSKFQLVNTVFAYISRHYIDFKTLEAQGVIRDALEGVDRIAPNVMTTVEPNRIKVKVNGMEETFYLGEENTWADLRDLLKEVLEFIESSGQCPVPMPELEYAALNGILTASTPTQGFIIPRTLRG